MYDLPSLPDKRELTATGCADFDRVSRERAVLTRQLQEAKMALADVKTSWSGQIASLETQVFTAADETLGLRGDEKQHQTFLLGTPQITLKTPRSRIYT